MVDLGTGTSFDVSSYPGYQNFTVDNFYISSFENGNLPNQTASGTSSNDNYGVYGSITCRKDYSQATGVLNYYIYSSATGWRGKTERSVTTSLTTSVHVYLIY